MSPLPDSPPTEIRSEREPTPRGCRAPSAGPMIRILFPPAASLLRLALRVSATSGERSASEIARRNIAITSGWQTSRTTVAPSLVKMDVSMSRLCGAGRSGGGRIRAARFAITLEGPRACWETSRRGRVWRFWPATPSRACSCRRSPRNRCVFGRRCNCGCRYTVGLMFWLWRNRFVGSYLFFIATRRS
jgi:hypothetical protein